MTTKRTPVADAVAVRVIDGRNPREIQRALDDSNWNRKMAAIRHRADRDRRLLGYVSILRGVTSVPT